MSSKEQKEKQQETLDREKYKRDKQIAIIKASNMMLEDAKEAVRSKWFDDPIKMDELLNDISVAQSDNIKAGEKYLGASSDEIENAQFGTVSDVYVKKYENHLQKIGKTDEEIRSKSSDGASSSGIKVVASSDTKKEKENKWFSFRKKKTEKSEDGEDIVTTIDNSKRTVIGEGYIPPETQAKTPEQTMKKIIDEIETTEEKKMEKNENVTNEVTTAKIEEKLGITDMAKAVEYPDFDPSSVNPLTRYDIIELPSKGECYPNKKGRIPVRELTAADENLIASPNMYANGQLIDTILKRCILDKNFDVDAMCTGDRDAVVMWLRATAYGPQFNVSTINPANGKVYETTVNLGDFKYRDFSLKADENGHFDYTFDNGDTVKFKVLSYKETQSIQEEIAMQYVNQKKFIVHQKIDEIKRQVDEIFRQELKDDVLNDAIDYISEWSNKVDNEASEEELYSDFVTKNIIRRTVSVNGNNDREYVRNYIESLRLSEAKKYREYIFNNIPGIDFSYEIEIPESDGGGSITSFLTYEETIFLE